MRTISKSLNDAVLDLLAMTNKVHPRNLKTEGGAKMRGAVNEVVHQAVASQLGRVDGDPRNLLKLALEVCGERGVALGDVADLINAYQEAHPRPAQPRAQTGDAA